MADSLGDGIGWNLRKGIRGRRCVRTVAGAGRLRTRLPKRLTGVLSGQMDSGSVQQRIVNALMKRQADILRPLSRIATQPPNPEVVTDNRRRVEIQEQRTA